MVMTPMSHRKVANVYSDIKLSILYHLKDFQFIDDLPQTLTVFKAINKAEYSKLTQGFVDVEAN